MPEGCYINLEGFDRAGKTTQAGMLVGRLKEEGWPAVLTRCPGGTPLGKTIRDILLHSEEIMDDRAECLLFAADMAQHYTEVVQPALDAGKVVVSDRGIGSAVAYQGYGNLHGPEWMAILYGWAIYERPPDLTVMLSVSPETEQQRVEAYASMPDRIERKPSDFQSRVRHAYERVLPGKYDWVTMDGNGTVDEVHEMLFGVVAARLAEMAVNRKVRV